jgi:pyruvate, water dikinase
MTMSRNTLMVLILAFLASACSGPSSSEPAGDVAIDWGAWEDEECVIADGDELPDGIPTMGCFVDFEHLASRPLDASIPGARSLKTVIDTADGNALHFLNAEKYPIHYFYCADHLSSAAGLPQVPPIMPFNMTEYFTPDRRFLLGAVTYYEGPDVWTYEIGPYDTSSAEMILKSYELVQQGAFFGDTLYFHPTSAQIEGVAAKLPPEIRVITTDDLYRDTVFLPLNPAVGVGRLRFFKVWQLESDVVFVTPQDIVVLDLIPNDIPVVAGVITGQLQTPLSHINVLSQNRGTPNMSLVGASTNKELRKLEGKWVRLTVNPFDYSIQEVTKAEADAWWEDHKPPAVIIPPMDASVTEIKDVQDLTLDDIPAFGGKASHYGILHGIGEPLRVPNGFAVPIHYYKQFEVNNGFDILIEGLLADEEFQNNIFYRQFVLERLQDEMKKAPVDPLFLAELTRKAEQVLPQLRVRFRSSTNAEDLDGFTGAGLYTSKSADPLDPDKPVVDAVRKVWASLWNFRAVEERSYRGIDQRGVGMALLCHRSFPLDDANGVALTNNIFNPEQPAFYVNVQLGEVPVVKPPLGIVPDQFVYYHTLPNQPISYLGHSNLLAEGETILNREEVYELGVALAAIHDRFTDYYFKLGGFYAMDVEFKFETATVFDEVCKSLCAEDAEECDLEPLCSIQPVTKKLLWMKQARPHYGWTGLSGQ